MLESVPKPRLMPGLAKLDQDKNESEESDSLATTISKISSEVKYSDKYLIQSSTRSNKLVSYVQFQEHDLDENPKNMRRYCAQCDKTFATVGSCTRRGKIFTILRW